jgi:hypothetical protein
MATPKQEQALRNLVAAALAWELADARWAKIADSKSATDAVRKTARANVMLALKNLRSAIRVLRPQLNPGKNPKKGSGFDWMKALNVTSKALTALNDAATKVPVGATRVIDVQGE